MDDDNKFANVSYVAIGSENNDVRICNCEKSKCLKLYCECFAKN